MFTRLALTSFAALGLAALAIRQGTIALACALVLAAAGLAWLWNRAALTRVDYQRSLSTARARIGDEIELTVRIANRKLLPLVSLWVRDSIPDGLDLLVDHRGQRPPVGTRALSHATALRWYERVTWRYRLRCTARGAYRFGPALLLAGDPFGIYSTSQQAPLGETLVVYPALIALPALGLPARHPLGTLRARTLLRDPLRTIGARDYAPTDPLRDIHWPATARTASLQTRVYEPTTASELVIVLDVDTFERYSEGIDVDLVERLISAAATVADTGLRQSFAVGLFANAGPVEGQHLVRLPPSRSPAQLTLVMETLARLGRYSMVSAARVIGLAMPELPIGTTLVMISAVAPEATRAVLVDQAQRGRLVTWLYMGKGSLPAAPKVRVVGVPRPGARPAGKRG